ncbi:hypothetical protein ACRN9F_23515 [Shewanella oncorhynchi]|jgi:hypothetical protein|uniref:Uncharacterized protein n=1 Tax=Shewanella decolorationis TaxID=256839 RepID=A0A5B8R5N4_9GAMM|nr:MULTISPECIES: hypothetical protein [Shewanella]EKO3723383.1 hypothetical protein [Vibrio metschnikovii]EKO3937860.1 hypothetical protein [Vibrio metschnikovii]MDH0450830.1 hypothetical protein [Shewanella sp. GD04112]MEE1982744.1 hypothetical protein [Shewanella xiamenensis]QWY79239.1 hypothetical protein D0436_25225 [Shewanella decolorationis]
MQNFTWSNFGILVKVSKSPTMILIENEQGQVLRMSLSKYQGSAIEVYQKAQQLIGNAVTVRTSQNTANWSTTEWFSDLKKESNLSAPVAIIDKTTCLSCDGEGFYFFAGGTKRNSCSNCEGTGIRPEFREPKERTVKLSDKKKFSVKPLNDYSNSYVDGDLGYINTKYWNGN